MSTFQLEKVYAVQPFQNVVHKVVADVHQFEGHIACDANSKLEIVVPIFKDDKIIGVLDIDAPITDPFDDNDKEHLEKLLKLLKSNSHKRTSAFSIKC